MPGTLQPCFRHRAIAFIDILGFKELVTKAEYESFSFGKLAGLKAVLENHARFNNDTVHASVPDDTKPKYLFISDSLIISAPMDVPGFDGLDIVLAKAIEVAHKLLDGGNILRGAIEIGNVWHEERNVFGSAYMAAYKHEEAEPNPRIVLCENARNHWRHRQATRPLDLCLDDGEDVIADTLLPSYIQGGGMHGQYEITFSQYRAHIFRTLEHLPSGSARSKWEWMAMAFNDAVDRHGVTVKKIKIPPLLNEEGLAHPMIQ